MRPAGSFPATVGRPAPAQEPPGRPILAQNCPRFRESPVRRLSWLAAALVAALPVALSAQVPDKSPVLIFVTVPPDARLAVNGQPTRQTGPERRLISPPIALGEKGTYKLSVTYEKDGKPVTVEREIVVTGGEVTRVDLTRA